ncbi:hypothetical protein BDQ12DRAFT_740049 [Crucibulum laeve]|uniref:Erythromycin biosynthesis protein CIII-like C-terminal domain-containing protein n=1 Tax=Crucibulum laeve TaxID=68775 RepID=A0A5C3LEU6_9AGAR|nr:hypothetical protein BDQ12DRAFT_740049 [Crucibulum laeve]
MVHSAPQRQVLLLTNSDYGQCTPFIALTQALAKQPNVHIHFASFAEAGTRVSKVWDSIQASRELGIGSSLTFYDIGGLSTSDVSSSRKPSAIAHPPGFFGAVRSYSKISQVALRWRAEQYMLGVKGCMRVIEDVGPHVIVLDHSFGQGYDACTKLGNNFILTGSFSLKELTMELQPSFILNYPVISSGFAYPLLWSQVLSNIGLFICLLLNLFTSPHFQSINAVRRAFGLPEALPIFRPFEKDVEFLAPMIPELDFHLTYIPENITLCGPLNLSVSSLAQYDVLMTKWLRTGQGRTVLVNLGAHKLRDKVTTVAIARALSSVLQHESDAGRYLQILWKLKVSEEAKVDDVINDELGKEMQKGRIRIVDWLDVEPFATLEEGHIICSVHHGGAGTFLESAVTGVTQIILPNAYDEYEYARRVEYLGVGIYANKLCAPDVDAAELASSLLQVIAPENEYSRRAKELAGICRDKCGGREKAARRILEVADGVLGKGKYS